MQGQAIEALVNEVVLRAQAQAEYSHENYGHFGLNLRRYAHFTSPIRRYADLIVHRALIRALGLGEGGLDDMRGGELAQIAEHISAAERRAMAAERETVDRLVAAHLADRVGAIFEGRIAGVTRVGLSSADGHGRRRLRACGDAGRRLFPLRGGDAPLVGSRTGETFRLGDAVEVRLVEAAPFAGALRFEIISGETRGDTGAGRASRPGPIRERARRAARASADERHVGFRWKPPRKSRRSARRSSTGSLDGVRPAAAAVFFAPISSSPPTCKVCGEDLSHARADDAPAYLTMLVVCHVVGGGVLLSDDMHAANVAPAVLFSGLTVTVVRACSLCRA